MQESKKISARKYFQRQNLKQEKHASERKVVSFQIVSSNVFFSFPRHCLKLQPYNYFNEPASLEHAENPTNGRSLVHSPLEIMAGNLAVEYKLDLNWFGYNSTFVRSFISMTVLLRTAVQYIVYELFFHWHAFPISNFAARNTFLH